MRIREGKRYVTRDGRVTGPMRRNDDRHTIWVARISWDESWYRGGKWCPGQESGLDLVAEYREDGE